MIDDETIERVAEATRRLPVSMARIVARRPQDLGLVVTVWGTELKVRSVWPHTRDLDAEIAGAELLVGKFEGRDGRTLDAAIERLREIRKYYR